MLFTVVGTVIVLLCGLMGYFRGLWRMLVFFLSLIASALLAPLLSAPFEALLRGSSFIPRTLQPLAGLILAALLLFVLFSILGGIMARRHEKKRIAAHLPAKEKWERVSGGLIGAVWGFALMVLITLGIQVIGDAQQAVMHVSVGRTAADRGRGQPDAPEAAGDDFFTRMRDETRATPFGSVAEMVNPLNERFWQTFENLVTVLSDPALFDKFRAHPDIARLTQHPKLIAVAEDGEIQSLIASGSYYRLLDNEKIAALARDPEIQRELKNLDFARILEAIIHGSERE